MKTPYSKLEMRTIKKLEKIIPKLKVNIIKGINLGQFEEGKKAYIQGRNLHLALLGANYGDRIIMAGIQDDKVLDKSPKSFKKMSDTISFITGKNIQVYSPFWKMSKSEVIKWMLKNTKNAKEILKMSVSCYSNTKGQCGRCPACLRKAIAFETCGLDIDFFENNVRKYSLIKEYIKNMKKGLYTKKRTEESLKVFKKWGWKI